MPNRVSVCAVPGCPALTAGGRCAAHGYQQAPRPSASEMGYGARWRHVRRGFLALNPTCLDCGRPATVADHAPLTRRELVARGEPNPDAWTHLQPRCASCHGRKTAIYDGAWGNPRRRRT